MSFLKYGFHADAVNSRYGITNHTLCHMLPTTKETPKKFGPKLSLNM
jgi:hypothetical protein